jgi:hypothetical protein
MVINLIKNYKEWITEGIEKIKLNTLNAYLIKTGWKREEDAGNWQLWESEGNYLYVPISEKFSDFKIRMADVANTLTNIEKRDMLFMLS